MGKIFAEQIKAGDVIMPPDRELNLWMRKYVVERGLSSAALFLTVKAVREGAPDKKGRWLIVECDHSSEWNQGRNALVFKFKVRPATPWNVVYQMKEA